MDTVPACETENCIAGAPPSVVCDLPYGNAEFLLHGHRHIAVARVYTLNICMGSLLASRTVNYELLKDGVWDRAFIECGSGYRHMRTSFLHAGYEAAKCQPDLSVPMVSADFDCLSCIETAAILHV